MPGEKAANDLCITEVSPLAQPCQWISGFALLLLVAGEKSRETKQVFLRAGGTTRTTARPG